MNQKTETQRKKRQNQRKLMNNFALTLSMGAMLFGLFWLVWILWTITTKGLGGISIAFFTEMTPPPNSEGGGLLNAIAGSGLLIFWSTLIGTPLGILAGVYLAEYRNSIISSSVRFINDILLSAPSIVIGLFAYSVVVTRMGHFSGIAGIVALALLQIPIIVRTTENILLLDPNSLREAAYALGTPKWKMILRITLKASASGILTGVLLAIARISGETAPLLFTALSNQFWSSDLTQPIANLPVTIYNFAMTPDGNLQSLAWAGVFFITICILIINILARMIFRQNKQR